MEHILSKTFCLEYLLYGEAQGISASGNREKYRRLNGNQDDSGNRKNMVKITKTKTAIGQGNV